MKSLAVALTFSAVLLGFGAAGAEPRVDAFGRPVDLGASTRAEISARMAAKMGSPIWSPLAIKILEAEGKVLPRAVAGGEIELLCMQRYRKDHPEQALEQYLAFLGTADGSRWKQACALDFVTGPKADPKLVDSVLASIEIGLMLPNLVQAVRKVKSQKGLADTPELTPEIEAKLPAMAEKAFAVSGCLMREIQKQKPFASLLTEPASIQPLMKELMQAGTCGMPAPPKQ